MGEPLRVAGEGMGDLRVLAVEFRVQRGNGRAEEIELWPLNLVVPDSPAPGGYGGNNNAPTTSFPMTIHTNRGDINVTAVANL